MTQKKHEKESAVDCDLLISGAKLVIPDQGIISADLLITGERISGIVARGTEVNAKSVIDARGLHALPGGIDPHVHWGNYGEFEDDAYSESRAAAIGGTTTVLLFQRIAADYSQADTGRFVNMPFAETRRRAEANSVIDFAFSPIIHDVESAERVEVLRREHQCTSFKFYLAYRDLPGALPGDDWNQVDDGLLLDTLISLGTIPGSLACIHAENSEILARSVKNAVKEPNDGLAAWDKANPTAAEVEAIRRAGTFAELAGVPLYVVHLSGEDALESFRRTKQYFPTTYGETCVHYLAHSSETGPVALKYSPPVRGNQDSDSLWAGLADGSVSCVASDSVCAPPSTKQGNVWDIARGAANAGIRLPLVLSSGVNSGRLTLEQAVRVTSENAARIFGLYPQKGVLAVGSDADIVLVDLAASLKSQEVFPTYENYNEFRITGWPTHTILRGALVAEDRRIIEDAPYGKFLPR